MSEILDFLLTQGFNKLWKKRDPEEDDKRGLVPDIDRFDVVKRVHIIHYLYYSSLHKRFTIMVRNGEEKRIGGGGVFQNKVDLPITIETVADAAEVVKLFSKSRFTG